MLNYSQHIPISLNAPTRPGLVGLGYKILNLDRTTYSDFTTAEVVESGSGFYSVSGPVAAPKPGGFLQWLVEGGNTLVAEGVIEPDNSLDLEARLSAIYNQLVADWHKGENRYTRYLPGTTTIILDKDVAFDATGFTVTQREQ